MANILVVERSRELREAFVDLLELEGHTIITAADDTSAWEQVNLTNFDLIVYDHALTEMNKFRFLTRVRQNRATARVPFIYLTHNTGEEDRRQAESLKATAVLVKPFDTATLLNLVRQWTAPGMGLLAMAAVATAAII